MFTKYCLDDNITKDEMGGVYRKDGGVEKCMQNFDWEV
jgi:hypothetical protein